MELTISIVYCEWQKLYKKAFEAQSSNGVTLYTYLM